MAKHKFIDKRFSAANLSLIETANEILMEYKQMRLRLSLRQLYYQLVSRNFIENTVQEYKRVGGIISDARMAGLVDWDMIEDRNREVVLPSSWDSPADIVRTAALAFRVDRWEGQENYVEVMVEKDALSGILEPVCNEYHVRFTANKGYSSSSAMYSAGRRIRSVLMDTEKEIQNIHIFYLGDHDPSGIDMTRDITERLIQFSGIHDWLENGSDPEDIITIHRIALNFPQIKQWNPPENPAKETDSRFKAYADTYGESSWELDAVEPRTLSRLLTKGIEELIDFTVWDKVLEKEKAMRDELQQFSDNYGKKKLRKIK